MKHVREPIGYTQKTSRFGGGDDNKYPVSGINVKVVQESEMVSVQLIHKWENEEDSQEYLLSIPATRLLARQLQRAVREYLESGDHYQPPATGAKR